MMERDTLSTASSGSYLVNRNEWEEARPAEEVHGGIFSLKVTNTPVILLFLLSFYFYFPLSITVTC